MGRDSNVVATDGRHSSTIEETGYRYRGTAAIEGTAMAGGSARFREKEGGGGGEGGEGGEGGKGHDLDSDDDTLTHRERKKTEPRKGRKRGERACTVNTHARRYIHTAAQAEQRNGLCALSPLSSAQWKRCCAML